VVGKIDEVGSPDAFGSFAIGVGSFRDCLNEALKFAGKAVG
jgi:hypothetical protein